MNPRLRKTIHINKYISTEIHRIVQLQKSTILCNNRKEYHYAFIEKHKILQIQKSAIL